MPTLDLPLNLIDLEADFTAGDWADASAAASLGLHAEGQLKRGVNLEVDGEALIQLEAGFHKFLAAGAQGRAFASAGVQAQVQQPLDLFDEAGIAVRLEAAARAGVSVRLGMGLSTADFIALAEQDPRIRGVPLKLLIIFLEEFKAEAGLTASAAVSAMAYAKLALTGRLVPTDGSQPGFTVAGEFGVGLEGGCGWQLYTHFGIEDPSRFLRRSIDIAVDETLSQLAAYLPEEMPEGVSPTVLQELRTPCKIALRLGFELGHELSKNPNAFDPDAAERMALRCVQVVLEEAQRYLIERFSSLGANLFFEALKKIGVSRAEWLGAEAQRRRLADVMERTPDDPFEPSVDNITYFADLINAFVDFGIALQEEDIDSAWAESIAIIWSAYQLMFTSVKRMSSVSARASLMGLEIGQSHAAFDGSLLDGAQPPPIVRRFVNQRLERALDADIQQEHLIEFLLDDVLLRQLITAFPDVRPVLDIIGGSQQLAFTESAKTLFRNIGAFAPGENGSTDAKASLHALLMGLQTYLHTRIDREVVPFVHDLLVDAPMLRLYFDEVLLATLRFTVNRVMRQVLDWQSGDVSTKSALREACSSILMQLIGRSLVVCADVFTAEAMKVVSAQLVEVAEHVDEPGGIAELLARHSPLERDVAAELSQETLRVAAEVFQPLPDANRQKIRHLLYGMVDSLPADGGGDYLAQLRQDFFIPDLDLAKELALELGRITVHNLELFTSRILTRVADIALDELSELVDEIEAGIKAWGDDLASLIGVMEARLRGLFGEIGLLSADVERFEAELYQRVRELLDFSVIDGVRAAVAEKMKDSMLAGASTLLNGNLSYLSLPEPGRKLVEDAMARTLETLLNSARATALFDALSALSDEDQTYMDELRGIEGGADLTARIMASFIDRVEDGVRRLYKGRDPVFYLSFHVTGSYDPAPLVTCVPFTDVCSEIKPPSISIDLVFDLGELSLPLDEILSGIRAVLLNQSALITAVQDIAVGLTQLVDAERGVEAAKIEHALLDEQKQQLSGQMEQMLLYKAGVMVLKPAPSELVEGELTVDLLLEGVPAHFLGLGEGEQQRIFIWLNQIALELEQAIVSPDEGGYDADAHTRQAASADKRQPSGSARVITRNKIKRRDLRPVLLRGQRARADAERLATRVGRLRLSIQVPEARLNAGINTLNIALLDGQGKRIEQAVSFVATASAPRKDPSVTAMPENPAWSFQHLDADLRSLAERRSGLFPGEKGSPVTASRGREARKAGGKRNSAWMAPRVQRRERVRREKMAFRKRFDAQTKLFAALSRSIEKGQWRPVDQSRQRRPHDKGEGG